jgi:hypothetical protein
MTNVDNIESCLEDLWRSCKQGRASLVVTLVATNNAPDLVISIDDKIHELFHHLTGYWRPSCTSSWELAEEHVIQSRNQQIWRQICRTGHSSTLTWLLSSIFIIWARELVTSTAKI